LLRACAFDRKGQRGQRGDFWQRSTASGGWRVAETPLSRCIDDSQEPSMNQKSLSALAASLVAATALAAAAITVQAASEKPAAEAPAKSALASLCEGCALVKDVHTEQRKGKGSGVGAVGGAVVGGLLGHQVGGGSGKSLMTVGGAVAGGVAGNEIEKRAKKHTVWVTRVTLRDGSVKSYTQANDPHLSSGDVVHIEGNTLRRR
jgi:outer membrane lipoprotein SlyB